MSRKREPNEDYSVFFITGSINKIFFALNPAYFLTFSKCSKLTLYISIKLMLWWMCCRESLFWRSSVTVGNTLLYIHFIYEIPRYL